MSESIEYKGYQIKISQDDSSLNPREDWDCNLGIMALSHKRYSFPNESGIDFNDYGSWSEVEKALRKNHGAIAILRVFMMDHSGLSFSTSPSTFKACDPQGWDWGCLGVIYTTDEKLKERGISDKTTEELEGFLRSEVETYAQYVTGEVYGYQIYGSDGEELDSCWGYFGSDHEKSGLLESARSEIDYDIQHKLKTEGEQQELALEV